MLSDEIFEKVNALYGNLSSQQKDWYEATEFTCPDGCGCCCHNFEPDLFESEAIFMAKWLVENQRETAMQIAEGTYKSGYTGKTCIFYAENTDFHCSIYGGRPFICRLFGASAAKDKTGQTVWRPCKFYPAPALQAHKPPLAHIQYTKIQTEALLGKCPPVMADIMEQAVMLMPENTETAPLREILPATVRKILFEEQLKSFKS